MSLENLKGKPKIINFLAIKLLQQKCSMICEIYIRMSASQARYSALVWSVVLLVVFSLSIGSSTEINDIYCLKSIKESLEDQSGYLQSWNFEDDYTTEVSICNFYGIGCWNQPVENRVREIRLSNMKLKGQFPLALINCTYLEALNLSFNELSGSIPYDISTILPSVTTLDLSHNRFSGEIPKHISDCSYLKVLKLNDNQLSGQIPPQLGLLTRLTTFSVANNQLAGPLPKFVSVNFALDSYSNNLELCGAPLEPCKSNDLLENFKKGFFVGYEVSAVFVTTGFMCYYGFLLWLQLKKSKKKVKLSPLRKKNQAREAYNLVKMLQQYEISELQRWVARISFQEISNATENFSKDNMIGSGKMGTMYKALLQNGCSIAVKRLNESPNQDKNLIHEIRSLGRLRHDNLVPLLGFCIERGERILVYKYMPNGNLYDWLHPGVEDDDDHEVMMKMEWPLRVKIAVGVARVLAWLHHNSNFSTVHLNINSNCILLDQNFEPKLSNFRGEILIDPNRHNSRNVREVNIEIWNMIIKKDVYDFGIVLLELLTLKEPSQMTGFCGSTTTPEDNLAEWVGRLLSSASAGIYQGIDTCLVGKGFDYEIFRMLRIASKCVQPLPDERPTMLQVYKKLRAVGERYGLTYNSGIAKQQPEDGIVEISI